ncbi:hypothetical protein METBIDRAFT_45630 [Metschnikowia bicuspidata var. bicuspidata NRRL YB-4993]|uniref:F-box domain-containing protein n=1 Tax=Metschnikowia bicuspidata var. bicuspidata NRRL YB-4993 TaxID=869754 RepID=A0A1A0H7E9_9ASCO|nr:hypothetical protein METBIDRAFT_45630 [Metschnikowia bicuspidata var. bicuspidata NRRL YB-4993]OBA19822.1 hypothetical protein METBIDRAFT_45630 [Metschnikowia bicuspidata var. bicuspidata NRRL YB-4993]
MTEIRKHDSLPPYRSLVNPSLTYDYQTHRVIHLSPLEIKDIVARFQSTQLQKPKTALQMKYRSLLSDVSMKALRITRKVLSLKNGHLHMGAPPGRASGRTNLTFQLLPPEILVTIFTYVDDRDSYRNCLYTSKSFYQLAKPFVYRHVCFTSTYRYAQFITCLRLNSALGSFVLDVDLSQLRAGNADNSEDINAYLSQVLAGWRDWKFKTNLYALHHVAVPMSKSCTNLVSAARSQNGTKHTKLSRYFKRRKSQSNVNVPDVSTLKLNTTSRQTTPGAARPHPTMNRFLLNHASSKDLPVGYILHLINLCPNLASLNLASLSLSTDYRVKRAFQSRYQSYDLMNNYSKDMLKIVESLGPSTLSTDHPAHQSILKSSLAGITSSASSIFSFGTFNTPVPKYNSLLPPVNLVAPDIQYGNKGDGRVFLSDLSLKSINTSHLEMIQQKEVFQCLQKRQPTLHYLNMSSMIWVNLKLIQEYLTTVFGSDLREVNIDGKKITLFRGKKYEVGEVIVDGDARDGESKSFRNKIIDIRNSGMNKNLPWAQIINTGTRVGERLVYRILNNELVSVDEENSARERNRRGRVGENYLL